MNDLRAAVLETARKMYAEELVAGTSGNTSSYDKERGLMAITPSSIPYLDMEVEDIVLMQLDGTIVDAKHKPSSEWKMHAKIYIERSDVTAVVHTHSPYATGFAVCNKRIPVILIEMVPYIGGDVPVAKYAQPGSESLGDEALKVLHNRTGCLLANHGTISIGSNMRDAYESAVYIEDAAKIYNYATTVGEVVEISEEDIKQMRGE